MRIAAPALALTLALTGAVSAQMKKTAPPPSGQMTPAAQPSIETARRISRDDAAKLVKEGKAVYVDVRSKDQFDLGHIKGALSIPGSQLISRLREVEPGKMIITYCACSAEQSSARAVLDLNAHGMRNAAALVGGWDVWRNEGRPTEVTKKK